MPLVQCYGMYGLVGGPFPYGFYYSAGLDVLGRKLREIAPTIQVLPTFGFSEWKRIAAHIEKQSNDTRIVIYGHSMGANLCTFVAAAVQRPVDLMAAFDPTVWYPRKQIGRNVRQIIWFRGCSRLSIAGHGELKVKSNYTGKFDRFDIRQRHETIDDNQDLHRIVIQAVRKL